MARNPLGDLSNSLGDYLREQRQNARLSVRQLSELAGVSNPYLSQIERGLKRPSAEILQQLAKGLSVSAESLYVRAGLLDPVEHPHSERLGVREAVSADPVLSGKQKASLLAVYDSYVAADIAATEAESSATVKPSAPPEPSTPSTAPKKKAAKKSAAKPATDLPADAG